MKKIKSIEFFSHNNKMFLIFHLPLSDGKYAEIMRFQYFSDCSYLSRDAEKITEHASTGMITQRFLD
jgi:hypothetical protein